MVFLNTVRNETVAVVLVSRKKGFIEFLQLTWVFHFILLLLLGLQLLFTLQVFLFEFLLDFFFEIELLDNFGYFILFFLAPRRTYDGNRYFKVRRLLLLRSCAWISTIFGLSGCSFPSNISVLRINIGILRFLGADHETHILLILLLVWRVPQMRKGLKVWKVAALYLLIHQKEVILQRRGGNILCPLKNLQYIVWDKLTPVIISAVVGWRINTLLRIHLPIELINEVLDAHIGLFAFQTFEIVLFGESKQFPLDFISLIFESIDILSEFLIVHILFPPVLVPLETAFRDTSAEHIFIDAQVDGAAAFLIIDSV